eukprot:CAMPEP_0173179302 /NCGR_PEP_ID=MMETSP1141-20130122/6033_1 /TAXON_ID=483371 /ORGANISM="non described non described, Strain CCMP2298" /LENGTH=72 /DNA_ID=CAMNT_0014101923 /DNA_START=1330 /DNA_END=1545 /DNA_ORIENTATION=+
MATSFAPSPIASVRTPGTPSFTRSTTSLFWSGDTLQHTTAWHSWLNRSSSPLQSVSPMTNMRLGPSMTRAMG